MKNDAVIKDGRTQLESYLTLNREDLEQRISAEGLRITRIIVAALIIGVILFFGVIMVLYSLGGGAEKINPASEALVSLMSKVLLGMMVIIIMVEALIPKLLLKPAWIARQLNRQMFGPNYKEIQEPVEKLIVIHRTVVIVRMALLEGGSLFGLVILLLSVFGGTLQVNPVHWLAVLPMVLHIVVGLKLFPTRASLADFIDRQILDPLKETVSSGEL